jgi:hypothetical protein
LRNLRGQATKDCGNSESKKISAPVIYLQPAIVALESDGNVFGIGSTEEECIADAISTAFYHDDEDGQRYPCTREWIECKLASGELYFLRAEDFDPSRQPQGKAGD